MNAAMNATLPRNRFAWRRRALPLVALATLAALGARRFASHDAHASDSDPRAWMEAGARACAPRAAALAPSLLAADPAHRIIAPFGALLFAYGESVELVRKYGAEAARTAEALRRTNPDLPVAIATNFPNASASPGSRARLFRTPPFAAVLPIRHDHMLYPSTVRPRYEWVTRAHYLARSPFELTLALDSHALPCTAADALANGSDWRAGNEVAAALRALPALGSPARAFDLAFNTFLTSGRPHNWALLYYTRAPAMRALFTDWYLAYLAQGGDDQGPLEHAARARARAGGLRLARLHTNLAGAFERLDDSQRSDWPRATHVLSAAVHLFHVRYGDEPARRRLCAMLNDPAHARRRRVLVQPRGGHKGLYAHRWPMAFSAAEYAAATGYAPPPRGHVNELVWEPVCAAANAGEVTDGPHEALVYPFSRHAQLSC